VVRHVLPVAPDSQDEVLDAVLIRSIHGRAFTISRPRVYVGPGNCFPVPLDQPFFMAAPIPYLFTRDQMNTVLRVKQIQTLAIQFMPFCKSTNSIIPGDFSFGHVSAHAR